MRPGERLLLHFGAVDYEASVWVNGTRAAEHIGGYTPFSIDVTRLLRSNQPQNVIVRAVDDPTIWRSLVASRTGCASHIRSGTRGQAVSGRACG